MCTALQQSDTHTEGRLCLSVYFCVWRCLVCTIECLLLYWRESRWSVCVCVCDAPPSPSSFHLVRCVLPTCFVSRCCAVCVGVRARTSGSLCVAPLILCAGGCCRCDRLLCCGCPYIYIYIYIMYIVFVCFSEGTDLWIMRATWGVRTRVLCKGSTSPLPPLSHRRACEGWKSSGGTIKKKKAERKAVTLPSECTCTHACVCMCASFSPFRVLSPPSILDGHR